MAMQIYNPSASFTRPADTTAYASGDLVANSTTAGSVTPMLIKLGNANSAKGMWRLTRVRLYKTSTSVANSNFRVHFYDTSGTITCANGDNGAWSTNQAANYLGNIDVTINFAFTDGAMGFGSASAGSEFLIQGLGGTGNNPPQVQCLLEARAAYTPGNAEVFTLVLEELATY